MTVLPLLGWLVAIALLLIVAWLWVDLADARRAAKRQRIRAEEADAWADEDERTAAALRAELDGLRERYVTLTVLYGEAVRRLLASNYVIIDANLAWKRRRQR